MSSATEFLQVKIGGKIYPITQILDKTVYAQRRTYLYEYPEDPKPKFMIEAGNSIGKVYSWLERTGTIWLMFNTNAANIKAKYTLGSFYVKLADVDESTLVKQGTKTTEQVIEEEKKKEEEKNESLTDKLLKTGTKIATGAIIALVGASILKSVIARGSN